MSRIEIREIGLIQTKGTGLPPLLEVERVFWPLFSAGSERLRDNRRMTDAAHSQHSETAARAIATAS